VVAQKPGFFSRFRLPTKLSGKTRFLTAPKRRDRVSKYIRIYAQNQLFKTMSNAGGKISAFQLEQIGAIAEQYDIGTCLPCAAAIKSYLKSQQIKGRHIRVETLSPYGLQGLIYDDGINQQIATNGFHEGIAIDIEGVEKVFDNLYHEGKPINQWLQDLVVIPGNQLNLINKEQF
jgi:hypothetical protein